MLFWFYVNGGDIFVGVKLCSLVIFELYDIFCIIVMWFDKDYSGMIDRWGD